MRKFTTAYLARLTKSHGFQRIQKELVHCANTLLSGSTMGARIRRKEMIKMLKETHSMLLERSKQHGDKKAFDAFEKAKEISLKDLEDKLTASKESESQDTNTDNGEGESQVPEGTTT